MFCFKQSALCAITLTAMIAAGCSLTDQPDKPDSIELQRSAMQRWNACLERNTVSQTLTAMKISHLLRYDCEGHKRDVIAVFPRHMSKQIDQLLIGSAYQLLESDRESMAVSPEQGELIQTLLR